MKRIELQPGTKYGKLTVIKASDIYHKIYMVQCECGTIKTVRKPDLIHSTRSCGCVNLEKIRSLNKLPATEAAVNYVLNQYNLNSKKKNRQFKITREEAKLIFQQDCYYCGSKPTNYMKSANGNLKYNGLDRVDNNKDYTLDNVVPCCKYCNKMKNNLTTKHFFSIIKKIYKKHIQKD